MAHRCLDLRRHLGRLELLVPAKVCLAVGVSVRAWWRAGGGGLDTRRLSASSPLVTVSHHWKREQGSRRLTDSWPPTSSTAATALLGEVRAWWPLAGFPLARVGRKRRKERGGARERQPPVRMSDWGRTEGSERHSAETGACGQGRPYAAARTLGATLGHSGHSKSCERRRTSGCALGPRAVLEGVRKRMCADAVALVDTAFSRSGTR